MTKFCSECGKPTAKTTKTLVNFILDRSGSMSSCYEATISGFNEYISKLQGDPNDYRFSFTLFDDEVEQRDTNVDLASIKPLNVDTYVLGGMTALFDAVMQTINNVEKTVDEDTKVLTVIMTDGGENASEEFTEQNLNDAVKRLEKTDRWSFIFLGANQDSWANAQKYGFSMNNVSNYNATTRGSGKAFTVLASSTAGLAGQSAGSTKTFFSDSDKEELENTK